MWSDIKNFGTLVRWDAACLRRCDPYLVWADLTTETASQGDGSIAVLVELKPDTSYATFRKGMNDTGAVNFIPNSLEQETGTRFVTGSTNVARLQFLIEQVAKGTVERLTLQQPRTDLVRSMAPHWSSVLDRLDPDVSGVQWAEGQYTSNGHDGTFLGVIDDGFPLHRAAALVGSTSRQFCCWDQGWTPRWGGAKSARLPPGGGAGWQTAWGHYTTTGTPPTGFHGFLYGWELKPAAAPSPRAYAGGDYMKPPPRHTHGAAVLGLAAPWLGWRQSAIAWPDHISGLALVQLPTSTVDDTSGGSLAMCVLDGLRYILWQESMHRPAGKARPVVVNISYGVHAGPHDGSSMFEQAVTEMLQRHSHLRVVLPAGNAQRSQCHARRELAARGEASASASLDLRVQPDNASDTHVELWLDGQADVVLKIQPPGCKTPVTLRKGEAKICGEADGSTLKRVHFAATYAEEPAQGIKRTMILLSIGSTRNDSSATQGLAQKRRLSVVGRPGLWRLTVENNAACGVMVDAWVERDDAAPDRSAGNRQAQFVGASVTREGTLNGIATLGHARAAVVGAMRCDGPLTDYSAAAQHVTQNLPTVVAPADWSRSVPGIRTMGFTAGAVARVNGTSAACAVYTRRCAIQSLLVGPYMQTPEVNGPPEHKDYPMINDDLRGQQSRRLIPFRLEP